MTPQLLAFGDSITEAPSSYAVRVADTLRRSITNYGTSGATMLGGEMDLGSPRSSIRDQMLNASAPPSSTRVVMILGTNDMILYGTDAAHLTAFQAALQTAILHQSSAGASVWIGTTLKQSAWVGLASEAARQAYVAAIESTAAAVLAMGRDIHVVATGDAYVPGTMGVDPPSNVHPTAAGHAALAGTFLTAMGS